MLPLALDAGHPAIERSNQLAQVVEEVGSASTGVSQRLSRLSGREYCAFVTTLITDGAAMPSDSQLSMSFRSPGTASTW